MSLLFHIYIFLPFMCWSGFPFLLSATRLGLLLWCFLGFFSVGSLKPKNTGRILKIFWFLLAMIMWVLVGNPVDIQIYSTAVVVLGLVLSWSWLCFYVYAIISKRAIMLIPIILIGVAAAGYWAKIPRGYHYAHRVPESLRRISYELDYALRRYRSDNNEQYPQSLSDLADYMDTAKNDLISGFQMPNYMESQTWNELERDVIICYEKNIRPEFRYYSFSIEKGGWKTRGSGCYVFCANGDMEYLEEGKLQEKLKSYKTGYSTQTYPISH